jgi:hypothetical protein
MPPPFQNRITCSAVGAWLLPERANSCLTFNPRNTPPAAAPRIRLRLSL